MTVDEIRKELEKTRQLILGSKSTDHMLALLTGAQLGILAEIAIQLIELTKKVSEQNQVVPAPLGATGAAKTEKES